MADVLKDAQKLLDQLKVSFSSMWLHGGLRLVHAQGLENAAAHSDAAAAAGAGAARCSGEAAAALGLKPARAQLTLNGPRLNPAKHTGRVQQAKVR